MPSMTSATRRWWTLAAVSLTQLLTVLDGTIVNVALPRAQADLALTDATRQWVVTGYALAFGAFLLLGGRVADFWGRKRTYLAGLVLFGVGSAWGGLASSAAELLIARGLQGFAAAFIAPAALAFVTINFPGGPERTKAFAIFGSLSGLGSALGMLLGGVLTEFASWRWCLLVNVPIVLLSVVVGVALLDEGRAEGPRRYDVLGALTATVGFGALVYGLTLAEHAWTTATLGLVGTGLGLIGLFVVVEHRAAHPLLPLRILADRTRAASFTLQAMVGLIGLGAMLFLAFHLQNVMGLPPLLAGLATLPFTAALMGAVPTSVRMLDRLGPRRQLVIGPLISALGTAWLARLSVDGSYWIDVLPGVIGLGLGMGFTVVPLQNLALLGIEPRDAGVASATATATNQLGGSIGVAVLTLAYAAGFAAAPADDVTAVVAGHSAVFALTTVLWVATAALSFVLIRPGRETGLVSEASGTSGTVEAELVPA